jgi:pyruvate dehydrogenase E1 component
MIPIYVFYSMFGFQRTGDSIWAAADQMTRGFLIGATAGRTTLTGEGLQHADGHSPLLASTNPAVVAYDPAYGYEIAHIMKDGLRRMYGEPEDPRGRNVIYYLTVYNEPIVQPAQPADLDVEGSSAGSTSCSRPPTRRPGRTQPRPGAVARLWRGRAVGVGGPGSCCADDFGVAADVWSVTSWSELRRDAMACDEQAFLHPDEPTRVPFVTQALRGRRGPCSPSRTTCGRAGPDRSVGARWVTSLGADGFGFSDTRQAARRFFHIDGPSLAVRTLQVLAARGEAPAEWARTAAEKYRLLDVTAGTSGSAGGDA